MDDVWLTRALVVMVYSALFMEWGKEDEEQPFKEVSIGIDVLAIYSCSSANRVPSSENNSSTRSTRLFRRRSHRAGKLIRSKISAAACYLCNLTLSCRSLGNHGYRSIPFSSALQTRIY